MVGLELTAPSAVTLADVNAVLGRIGEPELAAEDWAPLCTACPPLEEEDIRQALTLAAWSVGEQVLEVA